MTYAIHLIVVGLYLLVLLFVGARKARGVQSQADFSLAGRALSTPVMVGTLLATWIGTGSIFGNAEEAYGVGVAAFILPVSGALGIVALFFLAGRIRRTEHFTIQDILEERFGAPARLVGTAALLAAYVIIVSYQYRAGAAVLTRLAPELDASLAVILVAIFVIVYTALAGMLSVAYTDLANGVVMAVGLALALPVLVAKAGGGRAVLAALEPAQRDIWGHYSLVELVSVLLPTLLLILGDANMYTRFFSARDPRVARRSALGMLAGVICLELVIVACALVGRALHPGLVNPGHVIVHLAFESLPPVLGAFLVAAVLAVVVSTADSYLLSPATSLVRDVYQRFLNPAATDAAVVRASRCLVVVLGLVALGLAFASDAFFRVALFAYTLYGAAITPALLAALLWPRATPAAATASMVTGLVGALLWRWLISGRVLTAWARGSGRDGLADWAERVASADAVIPAAFASVAVLVLVSWARPNPRADLEVAAVPTSS